MRWSPLNRDWMRENHGSWKKEYDRSARENLRDQRWDLRKESRKWGSPQRMWQDKVCVSILMA